MDFLPSVVWKIFADVGIIEFGSLTLGNQFLIVALIFSAKIREENYIQIQ
jgi:hypothetical protein